jgi:hypothetical protein
MLIFLIFDFNKRMLMIIFILTLQTDNIVRTNRTFIDNVSFFLIVAKNAV